MLHVSHRVDVRKVFLILVLVLGGWISGGTHGVEADEVPYRHFTTFDGLPGNLVTVLAQTPNGLLWVGTGKGLAVYDGHEYRQISFPDSLGTAYIYSMAVGPDGSVWVSPSMGVAAKVGENGIERLFSLGKETYVREILSRKGEVVFLGANKYWTLESGAESPVGHSYRYEISSVSEVEGGSDVGVGVFDAALDPSGRIWVLDGRLGPGRLHSNGSVSFVEGKYGTRGDFWYEIGFAEEGSGVLTKGRRLFHFNPSTHRFREVTARLGDPTYLSVEDSVAYAVRDNTILRYDVTDARTRTPLGPSVGLPETMARRVHRGREGALWIGTRDGLIQIMNPDVRVLGSVDGNSIYNVHSFAASEEALWARTHGAGLIQLHPERGLSRPSGIVGWKYDIQGRDGFLHALASSARVWMRSRPSIGWERVRKVAQAVGGVVLEDGTGYFRHPDGLYRYAPDPEAQPDTLLSWSVEDDYTRLAPASGDALLLQKNELLFRVDTPSGTVLDTLGRLPNPQQSVAQSLGVDPRSLTIDDAGRIWTTHPRGGLSRLDPATGNRQTVLDNVPAWNVRALGDSLILGTSREKGLYLMEATTGKVLDHLTQADGLKSNGVLAAHILADTLYVAHSRGISLIPTEDLYREQSSPSVLLTGLEVGRKGRPLRTDTVRELDERTVGFSYTAASLSYASRISYSVRLVSQESGTKIRNWEETARRFVRYTNLGPGTYRFEVRARLGNAPPGPSATYTFTIPPHFYETWWFQIAVLLGLLGVGIAGYRWRTYQLRRRQEKLEGAVEDRTQELAAEKRKTEEQAERLSELDEAKNRFFAHVSHEFRTPLSLILTPLREALRRAEGDTVPLETKVAKGMVKNGRRLQRLIEQLLDLATLEAGRMELDRKPGDLARVVHRTAEAFTSMAEQHGITLQVRTDGAPMKSRFDPDKVESIVNNLLANALKFTPEGGTVTVWIGEQTAPYSTTDGDPGTAILKVADSGPGMDAETQDKIFERFEQAGATSDGSHEGIGLGLALTKELVELHGGTIHLESTPGEGTVLTVALPILPIPGENDDSEVTKPPEEDTPAPLEDTPRTGIRGMDAAETAAAMQKGGDGIPRGEDAPATVLVVEDNDEMRAYLQEKLSDQWRTIGAAEGTDGWSAVQDERPDLVVSDVMMPGMDGFELCEKVKGDPDLRSIPVILLTARSEAEATVEGFDCGADDFVAKPFDLEELRGRIESHLATRKHLKAEYREEVHLDLLDTVVDGEHVPFLKTVTETVEAHLGDPEFSVDRLAEAAALSRRQLTRRLKQATGETPAAFIRKCRLEGARELLENDPETIAEVAYAVGFRSPSAFSKTFREHVGVSPSEYIDQQAE